jgi:hypothetical protein
MVLRGVNVILIVFSPQLLQQIYNNELIRGRKCRRAARQLGNFVSLHFNCLHDISGSLFGFQRGEVKMKGII